MRLRRTATIGRSNSAARCHTKRLRNSVGLCDTRHVDRARLLLHVARPLLPLHVGRARPPRHVGPARLFLHVGHDGLRTGPAGHQARERLQLGREIELCIFPESSRVGFCGLATIESASQINGLVCQHLMSSDHVAPTDWDDRDRSAFEQSLLLPGAMRVSGPSDNRRDSA
jgi:hypothetical protein